MKTTKNIIALFASTLVLASSIANAKVSQQEADRLGADLTPIGAEKAANAAGTIPAWTGGFLVDYKAPQGFKAGQFHPNPFPEDKILFSIDGSNVAKYIENLSAGQLALIKKYPQSYKLNVYQTRRTAGYSDKIYQAAKQNALNTELVPTGTGLVNMNTTFPFPVAKNGVEAVWNHLTRYRGEAVKVYAASAAPQVNGMYTI
jgi:hypothetical protein